MVDTVNKEEYTEFLGVDIKSDAINRDPGFCSGDGQNIIYGPRGEIRRLPGKQLQLDSSLTATYSLLGIQLMEFDGYSQTNTRVKKLLGFNTAEQLVEITDNDFKVVYAGVGTASIEVGQANGTSSITLYVGGVSVYSETDVTKTVTQLQTAINALASWTCTIGDTNAYLRSMYRVKLQTFPAAGFVVRYRAASVLTIGLSTGAAYGNIIPPTAPTSDYVNASHVTLNNITYFTDFYGGISKFDGHYYYRAGLYPPTITTTSYNWGGTGPLSPGNIVTVAARAKFVDYGGNTHYSAFSFSTITVAGGNDGFYASVSNPVVGVMNTLQLIPSSNQFGVTTIATDATAGKVKVGDTVWITAGGAVQEREVTAVGANSITVDLATDARTTDHITHRVSIEVWCTTNVLSGTQNEVGPLYKIGEITVSFSGASKDVYRAQTDTDAVMTATRPILTNIRTWASYGSTTTAFPSAKYLSKFQTSLLIRDYTQNNLVHFSDQEGQEQFDLAVNNFEVDGDIKGIGAVKEFLAVFKETNIDIVVGDIQGFSVRVDRVEDFIGCVAHATIKNIDEGRLFFLSKKGPYQISSGVVTPIGPYVSKSGKMSSRLEPFYTENRGEDYTVAGVDSPYLALERSVAAIWPSRNIYMVYTPLESRQYPGYKYTSFPTGVEEVTTWAFDYEKGTWLPAWYIFPMCNGFEVNGEFNYLDRPYWASASSYYGTLNILNNTGTTKDFLTATGFYTAKYIFGWYHLETPSNFKKFLRVRLFCHEDIDNSTFTLDVEVESNFQAGTYLTNIPGVTFTVGAEKKVKLTTQKARAIRLTIENGVVNQDISINGVVLEWTPVYRRGIKE